MVGSVWVLEGVCLVCWSEEGQRERMMKNNEKRRLLFGFLAPHYSLSHYYTISLSFRPTVRVPLYVFACCKKRRVEKLANIFRPSQFNIPLDATLWQFRALLVIKSVRKERGFSIE